MKSAAPDPYENVPSPSHLLVENDDTTEQFSVKLNAFIDIGREDMNVVDMILHKAPFMNDGEFALAKAANVAANRPWRASDSIVPLASGPTY